MIQKSLKAWKVFICCQSQSDRQEQHTKNGGAPWLPEPSMENNDKHYPAPDGSVGSKFSTKNTQNVQNSVETPTVRSNQMISNQSQAVSVEKQTGETVRRSPMFPFPRLSRHLELLPSSESFAFDWRYFHLHQTQVIFSPTPFIMLNYTFIKRTYIFSTRAQSTRWNLSS